MARRIVKGGFQSYDPLEQFKRKLKGLPPSKAPEPRILIDQTKEEREQLERKAQMREDARRTKEIRGPTPEEQAALEKVVATVGEIEWTGDVEKDKLQYEQAIKSALATAGAGVAGGAAVGAAAGLIAGPAAPVTVPVAAGLGAIAGSVGGFIVGFKSNLQAQRKDMLKGEAANLMKQEQNMLKLIMETNKFGNYPVTLTYFNAQMSLVAENHARLKMETTDSLKNWLGEDGHRQLEKYEIFYSFGGMRDILVMQMQNAVISPDPSRNALLQTQLDISEKELGELEES